MQFNATVGQKSTGIALTVVAETEKEFVDLKWLLESLDPHDVMSRAHYFWATNSISINNGSIIYNPDLSTAKTVRVTAAYGTVKIH
jgi:hypothetical protein